jgi:flagellar hook-length control protein FliK
MQAASLVTTAVATLLNAQNANVKAQDGATEVHRFAELLSSVDSQIDSSVIENAGPFKPLSLTGTSASEAVRNLRNIIGEEGFQSTGAKSPSVADISLVTPEETAVRSARAPSEMTEGTVSEDESSAHQGNTELSEWLATLFPQPSPIQTSPLNASSQETEANSPTTSSSSRSFSLDISTKDLATKSTLPQTKATQHSTDDATVADRPAKIGAILASDSGPEKARRPTNTELLTGSQSEPIEPSPDASRSNFSTSTARIGSRDPLGTALLKPAMQQASPVQATAERDSSAYASNSEFKGMTLAADEMVGMQAVNDVGDEAFQPIAPRGSDLTQILKETPPIGLQSLIKEQLSESNTNRKFSTAGTVAQEASHSLRLRQASSITQPTFSKSELHKHSVPEARGHAPSIETRSTGRFSTADLESLGNREKEKMSSVQSSVQNSSSLVAHTASTATMLDIQPVKATHYSAASTPSEQSTDLEMGIGKRVTVPEPVPIAATPTLLAAMSGSPSPAESGAQSQESTAPTDSMQSKAPTQNTLPISELQEPSLGLVQALHQGSANQGTRELLPVTPPPSTSRFDAFIQPSVHSPAFAPAFSARIATLARDGLELARVHLNPVDMGPVSVQLSLDGQQVRVDMTADVAATRRVLEQALPTLAGALREAGFTLSGGGVHQPPTDARQSSSQDAGANSSSNPQGVGTPDNLSSSAGGAGGQGTAANPFREAPQNQGAFTNSRQLTVGEENALSATGTSAGLEGRPATGLVDVFA